jgi:hypothetical protein
LKIDDEILRFNDCAPEIDDEVLQFNDGAPKIDKKFSQFNKSQFPSLINPRNSKITFTAPEKMQ